ncbi:hypothetical protein L209DRAFT_759103 [Thermothelomyces heterothallicus CBS 203.75]
MTAKDPRLAWHRKQPAPPLPWACALRGVSQARWLGSFRMHNRGQIDQVEADKARCPDGRSRCQDGSESLGALLFFEPLQRRGCWLLEAPIRPSVVALHCRRFVRLAKLLGHRIAAVHQCVQRTLAR